MGARDEFRVGLNERLEETLRRIVERRFEKFDQLNDVLANGLEDEGSLPRGGDGQETLKVALSNEAVVVTRIEAMSDCDLNVVPRAQLNGRDRWMICSRRNEKVLVIHAYRADCMSRRSNPSQGETSDCRAGSFPQATWKSQTQLLKRRRHVFRELGGAWRTQSAYFVGPNSIGVLNPRKDKSSANPPTARRALR